MAVAFDARTNQGITLNDVSFGHTPVGTPRGVLFVGISSKDNDRSFSGVTYGGVALESVGYAGIGTPDGEVDILFLGSGIPTGPQTVAVDMIDDADEWIGTCVTITADGDTRVLGSGELSSASVTNPSVTVPAIEGDSTFIVGGIHSGQDSIASITPAASMTTAQEQDYATSECAGIYYVTNLVNASSHAYTITQAADAAVLVAVGVAEIGGPRIRPVQDTFPKTVMNRLSRRPA